MKRHNTILRACAVALALATTGCGEHVVVGGLEAREARRCAIALGAAGLEATVERDASSGDDVHMIVVHGDDADLRSALRVLDEHALPRDRSRGFATETSSLIPTPSEERAKFTKGLGGEIERLLESVDGVVSADVVVNLPERRPLLGASPESPTASVVIAHAGEAAPIAEEAVRDVVVNAVGVAVAPENVAVVMKPVVRLGSQRPVVRYERDRVVEGAFAVVVALVGAVETVTVWKLRAARRERGGGSDHES
jgi:type III secretion protein J